MTRQSPFRAARPATATLAVLLLAAGCADDQQQPAAPPLPCPTSTAAPLALAVGARANVPKPELPTLVQDLMADVARAHQSLRLIRLDGSPEIVFNTPAPATAGNPEADKRRVEEYLGKAKKAFAGEIRAKAAQADVLRALTLAGRATEPGGTVVLVDSGLQTTPPLRFGEDELLTAAPEDVVKFLRDGRQLPASLERRTVVLVGFGNTAPPQPTLDNNLHDRVVAIWKAIAEASGACVATVDQTGKSGSAVDTPEVAVVPTPKPPEFRPCGTVELGESDNISFTPNTANFRDPQAARQTLEKLADVMRDQRQRAELTGTTATDGPVEGRIALSARRAEAVKAMLVELGVPADHITTRGVGTDWPGHVPDIGPNGVLLPGPAAKNRKVVVSLSCRNGT